MQKVVLKYGEFGPKSMHAFSRLIHSLTELQLTGLTNLTKDLERELILGLSDHGFKIMKLRLTHMNLSDPETIDNLCEIIKTSSYLISLDLSWTHLTSKNLAVVSDSLL